MWDLVGNPEDRFSHNEVHIIFFRNALLSILSSCAVRFLSDLARNPVGRFCRNTYSFLFHHANMSVY